jgi:hypothetical protein
VPPPHRPGERPPGGHPPPYTPDYPPGVYYLYDNYTPEDSYLAGEPCRIFCRSDSRVWCSSPVGACRGMRDRIICDDEVIPCPR